jgi:transglutaminase-like putative cysteine protease
MLINQTFKHPLPKIAALSHFPDTHVTTFSKTPPILYSIEHVTKYSYSDTINHSKHLFRLLPGVDLSQQIIDFKFDVSVPGAELSNFSGVFGNNASFLEIKTPYKELVITSRSLIAVSPIDRKLDLLHQSRTVPLIWMPWDKVMMDAYLQPPELSEPELFVLAEYAMSFVARNHNDILAILDDINQTIHKEYSYQDNTTDFNTTAFDVFVHKKGVCQDFANLFICLARLLNIPARYRVGYIHTGSNYENQAQGDESHAWVEVFLPYIGWIGYDPTNGMMAGVDHIKVACGRYYRDATPTSGAIFNTHPEVEETLETSVKVLRLS